MLFISLVFIQIMVLIAPDTVSCRISISCHCENTNYLMEQHYKVTCITPATSVFTTIALTTLPFTLVFKNTLKQVDRSLISMYKIASDTNLLSHECAVGPNSGIVYSLHWLNNIYPQLYQGNTELIFVLDLICEHWDDAGCWYHSP